MEALSFWAPGVPVPKGSAKAFLHKQSGKVITRQDNADRQEPWASMIGLAAQQAGARVQDGPIEILITFRMPRLKSHFGTGKNSAKLKDGAPVYHTVTPDLDKLERCVLDALTGIAWADDKQVAKIGSIKVYADQPGAMIKIQRM